jgi:hypothetical protein
VVNLLIFIKGFYDFSTDFYELWPTFRIFMAFVASLQTYTDFMVINYDLQLYGRNSWHNINFTAVKY